MHCYTPLFTRLNAFHFVALIQCHLTYTVQTYQGEDGDRKMPAMPAIICRERTDTPDEMFLNKKQKMGYCVSGPSFDFVLCPLESTHQCILPLLLSWVVAT